MKPSVFKRLYMRLYGLYYVGNMNGVPLWCYKSFSVYNKKHYINRFLMRCCPPYRRRQFSKFQNAVDVCLRCLSERQAMNEKSEGKWLTD